MRLIALVLAALPGLAAAETVATHEAGGVRFELARRVDDPTLLDLTIAAQDAAPQRFEGVFYAGPANEPYFETLPTGAILIGELGCFACGRYHTMRSVTIAERGGDWTLIGFTESWVDRLGPWRGAVCDVNLAISAADIQLAERPKQRFAAPEDGMVPLADLTDGYRPQICGKTNLSDEEWQALKPADWDDDG